MAVTVEDVATVLGRTTPQPGSLEERQWQMWISDALLLIDTRRREVAPNKTLDTSIVDYVAREAVAAHVRRPDDATTVNTAVDDASVQRTYQRSTGRVAIIDDWWKMLGLSKAGKAYTVSLVDLNPRSNHLAWCNLAFGCPICSCGVDLVGEPIYEGGLGDL